MRHILPFLFANLMAAGICAQTEKMGYPITPVPFTAVKIANNTFWGQRLKASREVTIPLAFQKSEETNRYANFVNAAAHLKDSTKVFDVKKNMGFSFDDTDPYKTLEGASYLMQSYPDAKILNTPIDRYCDSVISIIASGQEPDGYLYTARTQNPHNPHGWAGDKRWQKVEDLSHELYNLGHLCEAAVAHYNATGKKSLLNIACRYADCVCREVGSKPGQAKVVPGHQIAEMGLAKLFIATGKRRYLEQAKFFLDQRGQSDPTWKKIQDGIFYDKDGYLHKIDQYGQSHKPVLQQDEAVGHAVRAGYMYAGMADIAALTGDNNYIKAIDRIWENIVSKKYYITGGVGATGSGEAFGENYQLPNGTAYCETCAAIAQVYLNYRLFLLHGESKYFDILERTLYNGVLSGISIDGGRFFYPNPLQSSGQHQRSEWFGCACCPSNAARFIPSFPQYIYAVKGTDLYVNLFAGNEMTTRVNGRTVTLQQDTDYPWNGKIHLTMKKASGKFALRIRIPGWLQGQVVPSDLYRYADEKKLSYRIKVNGTAVEGNLQKGYFVIERKWNSGDNIDIDFDMQPRIVKAHSNVEADRNMVSIERGPLVYCAEWCDNTFPLPDVKLDKDTQFVLGETTIAETKVLTLDTKVKFPSLSNNGEHAILRLIPYYAWAHRGKGYMTVWMPFQQ